MLYSKRGFGKKGISDRVYFTIFELLIIFLIYVSLGSYVKSITNNSLLEKNFYSRDIAMLLNAVYAAPGNVEYKYSLESLAASGLDFEFMVADQKVVVKSTGTNDLFYPYFEDLGFRNPSASFTTSHGNVFFVKSGNEVRISSSSSIADLGLFSCPSVQTSDDIKKKKVVVDSFSDKYPDLARDYSNYLRLALLPELAEVLVMPSDNKENFVSQQKPNMVVVLRFVESSENSVSAVFSSSSQHKLKSEKLACLVLNNFKKSEFDNEVRLTPAVAIVDDSFLFDDSVSVLITVSVLESYRSAFAGKYNEFIRIIINSVKEYYAPDRTGFSGSMFDGFPLDGRITVTSCFGQRTFGDMWHDGIDFGRSTGTPVKAVGPGVVYRARNIDDFGNSVVIKHNDNLYTAYNHLSSIKVREGRKVNAGDILGLVGSTGISTGPHLDFKVYTSASAVWGKETGINPHCVLPLDAAHDVTFDKSASGCFGERGERHKSCDRCYKHGRCN